MTKWKEVHLVKINTVLTVLIKLFYKLKEIVKIQVDCFRICENYKVNIKK